MHDYSVELRIHGTDLVPATITQELKLEPCLVREVGEFRGGGTVWDKALWAYSGFPAGRSKLWSSLEDGLKVILDRMEPFQIQIDNYKQKYELVWWCGHFQSSFDGGPTLSTQLMRRLADFGVDLYIDNYFGESEPLDID